MSQCKYADIYVISEWSYTISRARVGHILAIMSNLSCHFRVVTNNIQDEVWDKC